MGNCFGADAAKNREVIFFGDPDIGGALGLDEPTCSESGGGCTDEPPPIPPATSGASEEENGGGVDENEDDSQTEDANMQSPPVVQFRRSSIAKPPDAMWSPDMGTPEMRTGWAWKQGHRIKSWKKRYFVLYEGTLKYYVKYDADTGMAKNEKDSLNLKNYVFGILPDMDNKIYIKPDQENKDAIVQDKDLLLDFFEMDGYEPDVECHRWTKAITQHILYANKNL
jgi:hypothetical protein